MGAPREEWECWLPPDHMSSVSHLRAGAGKRAAKLPVPQNPCKSASKDKVCVFACTQKSTSVESGVSGACSQAPAELWISEERG